MYIYIYIYTYIHIHDITTNLTNRIVVPGRRRGLAGTRRAARGGVDARRRPLAPMLPILYYDLT